MKEHVTWTIPERRVAKFVKKGKRAMKKGEDGKSGLFGKLLGSNKQKSTDNSLDDGTAATPEMHPGSSKTSSPSKFGNLVKAFSKKSKASSEPIATNDSIFRESKLDAGTDKTMLPYENAELERKESAIEEANAAEPTEGVQVAVAEEEEKVDETPNEALKETLEAAYEDDNDYQRHLCECRACVIL